MVRGFCLAASGLRSAPNGGLDPEGQLVQAGAVTTYTNGSHCALNSSP